MQNEQLTMTLQVDMANRLKEMLKKIEYTPFPEQTMIANLGNQFTDYALNCIVVELIKNGVIVPPCEIEPVVGEFKHICGNRIETTKNIRYEWRETTVFRYEDKGSEENNNAE
ncbi:MAG: hypothetical protein IKL46_05015 [Clostridia bacterium]|nr:hypothetical protein [Clostridia bacterium]